MNKETQAMPKIIQITSTTSPTGVPIVYALCDNGDIYDYYQGAWSQLPPLPDNK